jgi:phosphoribosylglycinamide formyltransferase-1
MKQLGVLVSGRGSNLQALIEAVESGRLAARIAIVISNKPNVPAIDRSEAHGIPSQVISHKDYETREAFEKAMEDCLKSHHVDFVVLAGFMRILSPYFIRAFPMKIINIHPALLPSFPGTHAQKQALDYGVKFTGCTVHFVDEGVDTGPVIAQTVVPVLDTDTEETLSERILLEEHKTLIEAIDRVARGNYIIQGRRVMDMDKQTP